MQRTLNLDTQSLAPFEIGAMLYSVLAFPRPDEVEAGCAAAEALCAQIIGKTIAANPDRADTLRSEYSEYAEIDAADCRRKLRELNRRFRDRMVASSMAMPFLFEGLARQKAKLPTSVANPTLKELSKFALPDSGQKYARNVRKRIWAPSRPVIHLAAAMQIYLRNAAPDAPGADYPLENGVLHAAIVKRAQLHEEIVLSDRRFGKCAEELIRIRIGPGPY